MIPVYAISLPDHAERRRHIQAECARVGLNAEIVDAADMRRATPEEIRAQCRLPAAKRRKKQRYLTAGELGCALSHRAVYQTVLARGQDYALVLEDDARFLADPAPLLRSGSLQNIAAQYPFDVLILGYVKTLPQHLPYYYRRIPLKNRAVFAGYRFGTPWEQYGCGAVGYVITAAGAAKLLSQPQPCVAADDWLYFERQLGLRVLHARPALILEHAEALNSTIRTEAAVFLQPKLSSVIVRSTKGCLKHIAMNYLGFKS